MTRRRPMKVRPLEYWVGCGECDESFRCFDGKTSCLRLVPPRHCPKCDSKVIPVNDGELKCQTCLIYYVDGGWREVCCDEYHVHGRNCTIPVPLASDKLTPTYAKTDPMKLDKTTLQALLEEATYRTKVAKLAFNSIDPYDNANASAIKLAAEERDHWKATQDWLSEKLKEAK